MIGYLSGDVLRKRENTIILNVGGVGYLVHMTKTAIASLKESANLFTTTVFQQFDTRIFGFDKELECRLFETLITVNGVGPKAAITMIDSIPWDELVVAIETKDDKKLTKVKGIGGKTANLIILKLQDKLQNFHQFIDSDAIRTKDESGQLLKDCVAALAGLGYQRTQAKEIVAQNDLTGLTLEQAIPKLLRSITQRGPANVSQRE